MSELGVFLIAFAVALTLALFVFVPKIPTWSQNRASVLLEEKKRMQSAVLQDATVRVSSAVLRGRVGEQLAPMRKNFPFNPSDARFIGSPIDFIVFDGYSDIRDGVETSLRSIVFIDVKAGKSGLTKIERQVRACVESGHVAWRAIQLTQLALSASQHQTRSSHE